MLINGLSNLSDIELFLNESPDYLYSDYGDTHEFGKNMYNIGGLLPPERKVVLEPDIIKERIRHHFFDAVIYGSFRRKRVFLMDVLEHYQTGEVFFIDGEDDTYISELMMELSSFCHCFKRELTDQYSDRIYPIAFAAPPQNIVTDPDNIIAGKTRLLAYIIPGHLETYIYDNVNDYNKGYQTACFGVTHKKGGWDCNRHYEILANGCIPYFPDIEDCPHSTLFNFPKNIISQTNRIYKRWSEQGIETYDDLSEFSGIYRYYLSLLMNYTRENLTTVSLARYVLSFYKRGI
jgi:hypothetical protein